MEAIKVFAPATVANLSCGFDVLGCCLDSIGDEMLVRKNDLNRIQITAIRGSDLPTDPKKNVAGVAIRALLDKLGSNQGFDIEIHKKIKPGSGIGSSAASSAGAVYAANRLLGNVFGQHELIAFAMKGEELASGNPHADNVAPALLGGFSLVKSYCPLEVLKLPVPADLRMVVLHPHIEIRTKDSRSIIKQNVSLKLAINQWGNLAALVSALYTSDYELLGRSLHDDIVEPIRSILIPRFDELRELTIKNGALGFGISGSGPSVFALCKGDEIANRVKQEINSFYNNEDIDFGIYSSKINEKGVKEL